MALFRNSRRKSSCALYDSPSILSTANSHAWKTRSRLREHTSVVLMFAWRTIDCTCWRLAPPRSPSVTAACRRLCALPFLPPCVFLRSREKAGDNIPLRAFPSAHRRCNKIYTVTVETPFATARLHLSSRPRHLPDEAREGRPREERVGAHHVGRRLQHH